MGKKEVDRTICKKVNRKAQITIFMIVGLLILFVFIFLITLSSNLKKSQLEQAQEEVYGKAFKKEAMRIYVEDCLSDELEKGLILLGKQGRIWDSQPGGTRTFVENITGLTSLTIEADQIAYGITRKEYFSEQNAYPCDNGNNSPEYCQYQYPQSGIEFGDLVIKTSTLKTDLQRYLINRTVWCVHNYTQSNISRKAEIEPAKMNLKLDILDDGIDIKAEYPLKFKIGKEEFFHLSVFDFFYPTQFKWMLESAIARPLFYDWKYLDFNYTEQTLTKNTFSYASNYSSCTPYEDYYLCNGTLFLDKYKSLSIDMKKEELGNGDDLFIFQSPKILNLPGMYEFRTIRQNRPPALDYVERLACPEKGYDYLVIIGDNSSDQLGGINVTAFALDPDEDNITYLMEFEGKTEMTKSFVANSEDIKNDYLAGDIGDFNLGYNNVTVTVTDQHGLNDWQTVRFLVDRPLDINFTLSLPYTINGFAYNDLMSPNYFTISNEDPIFINITYPENSATNNKPAITLKYSSDKENFNISMYNPNGDYKNFAGKELCLNLPFNDVSTSCKLSSFEDKIDQWDDYLLDGTTYYYPYFKETSLGKLNISFSTNYCTNNKGESKTINVRVAECIPHENPTHPWPYMPNDAKELYKWELQTDNSGNTELVYVDDFSPFLATHTCCNPNGWEVYEEEDNITCYESDPVKGCFGNSDQVQGYNQGSGYLLEEEIIKRYCDGERGNLCGGDPKREWDSLGVCGNRLYPDCDLVAKECEDGNPYHVGDLDSGSWYWCDGDLGCGINNQACKTIAVDINGDGLFAQGDLCGENNCGSIGQKCLDLVNKKPGTCQPGASSSALKCT
jgi:hypothetical protein